MTMLFQADVRPGCSDDLAYVASTWYHSVRELFEAVARDDLRRGVDACLEQCLDGGHKLHVATPRGSGDVIWGWTLGVPHRSFVRFGYVQEPRRRSGLLARILAEAGYDREGMAVPSSALTASGRRVVKVWGCKVLPAL